MKSFAGFLPKEGPKVSLPSALQSSLVFGLLQFVTTFALAFVYSRFSTAKLDPLAHDLDAAYQKGRAQR